MRRTYLFAAIGLACVMGADAALARQQPKPQISPATREKAEQTNSNPDALVLDDFQKRVAAYMTVHKAAAKDSPRLKETSNPGEIQGAQKALATTIRAARATAKPGDIFTPEIRNKFRRLMYPELKGAAGREVREELKEDVRERDEGAPKPVPMKVNAAYPEGNPLPTTPTNLLGALPKLPEELEYRIIGRNLILRDVQANIIVDFVPNAIQ